MASSGDVSTASPKRLLLLGQDAQFSNSALISGSRGLPPLSSFWLHRLQVQTLTHGRRDHQPRDLRSFELRISALTTSRRRLEDVGRIISAKPKRLGTE
jgi:hypothetical protein